MSVFEDASDDLTIVKHEDSYMRTTGYENIVHADMCVSTTMLILSPSSTTTSSTPTRRLWHGYVCGELNDNTNPSSCPVMHVLDDVVKRHEIEQILTRLLKKI